MSIVERLKLLSEKEKITITALEKKIGASKGVLSRALKNNTDIQSKWVSIVVDNYPQYNPLWLLTGKGEMMLLSEVNAPKGPTSNKTTDYFDCPICEEKEKSIDLYRGLITDLMNDKRKLQEDKQHLREEVEHLRQQIKEISKSVDTGKRNSA